MATFPSYACILLDGYSEQADYGVLRSETDAAIDKVRPRWTLAKVTRDIRIKVDSLADKKLFDTWFRDDIKRGTDWFDWVDPLTETTKRARLVGMIKWESPGRLWIAATQLETLE